MCMRFALACVLCAVAAASSARAQTCTFSISPTTATFTSAGGSDVINITLVTGAATCQRTATSNANWITISYGTPGTGSGTVGYTVQSNPFPVERTGTITVAGQTHTVTEAAGSCTYSISPSSATIAANGGTGSFNLTTSLNSCAWTAASSSPDWLAVSSTASGAGNATIRYTAGPNPSSTSRSASITVGTQTFNLTQSGQCSFTLSPSAVTASGAATTGSITVTASASSCAWTAAAQNDWITLTGATSGTGNGTVAYSLAANTSGADRTGSITIGTSGVAIFQSGSSCTLTFSANGQSFPASGGTGAFYVNGACPWTASSNASWISILSGGSSATGSGTVNYIVSGNTDTAARTGYISVGTRSYSIQQAGVPCSVTLTANSAAAPASGTSGAIHVSAGTGCTWTASTVASWITLRNASGTGEDDVAYTVSANTSPQARSADVIIANQRFTISQAGGDCAYQITPAQATYPALGGSGTINVATGCSWSAATTASWITLASTAAQTGNAAVTYTVAANTSSDARSAAIRIAGQSVTITQSGKDCTLTVAPNAVELPGAGGSTIVTVTGSKGCRWEPREDSNWIDVPKWASVDGSGTVTIRAAANPDPNPRYGAVYIAGQGIAITQGGVEVTLARNGVFNAASFAAGPVAPGEIVTIFGAGLGPSNLAKLELAPDGQHIASKLAGIEVQFDGIAAPLIYVMNTQVSAVVPYSVAGKTTTELRVVNQGVSSDALQLNVSPASPAVFTVDASGRGQAAVLNQDNTVNSAQNAAARNTVIQIFATGEGQTNPPGEDGRIANGTTLPRPLQNVTVSIGGQNATVVYAGAAPDAVAGLFQVNARIPQNVAPGSAIPVVISVGQARSQNAVTIAVR